ncbi:MAG: methylated-DNA--[protein]-cysteine S-methyltransferase [Candidatus Hodarchaeales archaeon]
MMTNLCWKIIAIHKHFLGVCVSKRGLYACTLPFKSEKSLMKEIASFKIETDQKIEITNDPTLIEVGEYLWSLWEGINKNKQPNFTINFDGYSTKQIKVYKTAMKIPRGEVRTYGELAMEAGFENAARFVGTCMRKNRFPLIVPCHRVVRNNGLGQYGSDPDLKRILLEREGFNVVERFGKKRSYKRKTPI